ncbi:MAG: Wzz/FepE/Etk N-terminal domain-containing protein [Candidatus Competibacter sp.]|nr:Wzz/FepE/Etk N-terminal domain-containing protein [Candidatus Competibacter sp.]MDG4584415.1 Wzz/FepE/Etk N-terminal domain-containing protein [Candidatus Competibacter sp.]
MNDIVDLALSYLRGVWRHRWYALGCAWLICVIGWIVIFKLPDQYEASARIFVDNQSVLQPLLKGLTVDVDPNAQVGLVARTLLSRPNLERIIQLSYLDRRMNDPEALDRLVNMLQQRITLQQIGPKEENLYKITFEDRDPIQAKSVVQAVVKVFEDNLGEAHPDADVAQLFLEKQINEYENRLIEAENRLKDFKLKNIGLMPSEGQTYNARIQQATAALDVARLELAQAEKRRNALQQELDRSLQRQLKGGEGEQTIVLPIDGRIHGLEQKLSDLLVQYTDRHPDVSILRKTIADLKEQREQERAQYAANLAESGGGARNPKVYSFIDELKIKLAEEEANAASLQVRVDEYIRRYRELKAQVNILPRVEAELAALNRDYEIDRRKHDDLVSRREALKLSERAEQSKQEVRFRVVDPPRVPIKPTGPRRLLLMTLVLGAGLGAGMGLGFLLSQLWPTFDSRRSLMEGTGIPVFGSVGNMLSPPALRRSRWLAVAYVSLGGMLLVVYAALIAIVERVDLL